MKLIKFLGLKAPAKLKSQSNNKSLSQKRFLFLATFYFISNQFHLLVSNVCYFVANKCFKGTNKCFKAANKCFEGTNKCFKGTKKCFKGANKCFKGANKCFEGTNKWLKGTNIYWCVIEQKIDNIIAKLNVINRKEHIKHLLNQHIIILLRIPNHKGAIFRQRLRVINY